MKIEPSRVRVGDQFVWRHPKLKTTLSGTVIGTTPYSLVTDCEECGSDSAVRKPGTVSRARWLVEGAMGRISVVRHKPLPQPTPPCGVGEPETLAA